MPTGNWTWLDSVSSDTVTDLLKLTKQQLDRPADGATGADSTAGLTTATVEGITSSLAADMLVEANARLAADVSAPTVVSPAQNLARAVGDFDLATAVDPFMTGMAPPAVAPAPTIDATAYDKLWPSADPSQTRTAAMHKPAAQGVATVHSLLTRLRPDIISEARPISLMAAGVRVPKVGIALSGGGAKGDFEVGALRFIYDRLLGDPAYGIPKRPDVIAGTSVGAINGGKLAEGHADSLDQLEAIWESLRANQDIYLEELDIPSLLGPLGDSARRGAEAVFFSSLMTGFVMLSPALIITGLQVLANLQNEARNVLHRLDRVRSIYNLNPIRRRLDQFAPYWSLTGPGLRGSSLAVGWDTAGRIVLVARGYNDGLYVAVRRSDPSAWPPAFSEWLGLGRTDADPALVSDDSGRLASIIARSPEDGRYHELQLIGDASRRDGWEATWRPHGYPIIVNYGATGVGGEGVRWTTPPSVGSGSFTSDRFLFARGTDSIPYVQARATGTGRWSAFVAMGTSGAQAVPVIIASDIGFGRSRDGWKFAFARRPNDAIVVCAAPPDDDGWRTWDLFGGSTPADLTVTQDPTGRLHVIVVGMDKAVWLRSQAPSLGNAWGDWRRIDAVVTSVVAVARDATDNTVAFVRGLDYGIFATPLLTADGSMHPQAGAWLSLGAPAGIRFLTDPVVVRRPDGMAEVFAVGHDRKLWTIAQSGPSTFGTWNALPGAFYTGIELRLAAVAVETGELRHVDESGRFVESMEVPVGVPAGIMASASIPAIFPAVRMNELAYVDGGVRSITPIQAAIDAGAELIYAVCVSPPALEPSGHHALLQTLERDVFGRFDPPAEIRDWSAASVVDVGMRTLDMLPHSIAQNELRPRQSWPVPVVVVQPSFDVHDAFTIRPEFIALARSYGWMRAYEAATLPEPFEAMQSTDAIISLRRRVVEAESRFVAGMRAAMPPDIELDEEERLLATASAFRAVNQHLPQIRALKSELAHRLNERRGQGWELPDGNEQWATTWEHQWLNTRFPNGPFAALSIAVADGSTVSAPATAMT